MTSPCCSHDQQTRLRDAHHEALETLDAATAPVPVAIETPNARVMRRFFSPPTPPPTPPLPPIDPNVEFDDLSVLGSTVDRRRLVTEVPPLLPLTRLTTTSIRWVIVACDNPHLVTLQNNQDAASHTNHHHDSDNHNLDDDNHADYQVDESSYLSLHTTTYDNHRGDDRRADDDA